MELNEAAFGGPYSSTNATKLLFHRIKNCADITIMGTNQFTDCQLITNAVCLLLTTGLYQRAFKEWDRLNAAVQQMQIALWMLIQEVFQHRLNVTAPTAGHHGYALARPFQTSIWGVNRGLR
jgi:hypothetical protein